MTRRPDTTALSVAINHDEVAAFRAAEHTDWRWDDKAGLGAGAAIVVGVLFGLLPLVTTTLIDVSGSAVEVPSLARIAPPLVLAGSVAWAVLVRRGAWSAWERRLRFARFGRANGLAFTEATDVTDFAGAPFQLGDARERFWYFRSTTGPSREYGGYHWTTGFGQYRDDHVIGYVAVRLDAPLPSLLLDTGVPERFTSTDPLARVRPRGQRVPLATGATLWCAPEHASAARSAFTPELLAVLGDDVGRLDVEVVDDWIFLYGGAPFDWREPATWERLVPTTDRVVDALRKAFTD